ncbi:hypothetical protein DID88_010413 [Monilinia fructigena]|uniref:RNase H type-1 domain-containing protein n=1 Tax=Monilinia fructigena TaxID=38457 RepID=A0A395IL26_9HELO|nr:hypothetical protein DID88_010413 [Monilinia fructigena]
MPGLLQPVALHPLRALRPQQHPIRPALWPLRIQLYEPPQCANCHGPFDANHARCPAVPKRVNGKYIKPTRKELDAIRKHGELAFKTVNTPPPATPTPASSIGAPVIAPPKRKRGAAVTAHENAGQRAPKPDCAPHAMLSSPMPDSDPPSDSDESMAEDEDELTTLAPLTLEQHHYRIPELQLGKFADLVHLRISGLPDARHLSDAEGIEHFVQLFTLILDSAIYTAGKPDRGRGRAAPMVDPRMPGCTPRTSGGSKNTLDSDNPGNQGVLKYNAEGQEGVINWYKLGTNLKAPPLVVNGNTVEGTMEKAETLWLEVLNRFSLALRWLGVWFDRRLTFKRHVAERAGKARQIARHIRGLAKTVDGPPASALRKAVITCVIPSLAYGTEAWYAGRTKPPRLLRSGRSTTVSARVGWHIGTLDKTLSLAVRGVLPVWRTTPTVTLYRDAGIPSAEAMLEEAKLRFALRIQTVDEAHPWQVAKTKVQRLGGLFPQVLRPTLRPPHYTHGCRVDPTGGVDKETAAAAFKTWWNDLPPDDVTIFSDGSEQYHERQKYVGYGYAIYQNRKQIGSGSGSINPISHVFDAEAIGAWRGLQHTLRMPQEVRSQRLWMCIDSTSVIWCLRANASASSQWAFIACQNAMQVYNIRIKWSPGHTEIEGNEAADRLADTGAHTPDCDPGPASLPIISGIRLHIS